MVSDGIKKWIVDRKGRSFVANQIKKKLKNSTTCSCCKSLGKASWVDVLSKPKNNSGLPLCPECAVEIKALNASGWNQVREFLKQSDLKRKLTKDAVKFS